MWTFPDKAGRGCCLVPEITGLIQETWRSSWSRDPLAPRKLFYVARCYRYERPQAGRYREFTQFGIEILGNLSPKANDEAIAALQACLSRFEGSFEFQGAVRRGLAYYVDDGFEVECPDLGAQKQVAGGGRYLEGVGWAIGVERLILATEKCRSPQ